MKIIILIVFLFTNVNELVAHNLQGKWLETNDGDIYTIPRISILEFENKKVKHYNFDQLISEEVFKISNNFLIVNGVNWGKFSWLNNERFCLSIQSNGKIYNIEYVRLKPTVLKLEKNLIEKFTYHFKWNNEEKVIIFNPVIVKSQEDQTILETIDSVYFASIYINGKREIVIPIKKADRDGIEFYGMPDKPYYVFAMSSK